MPKKAVAIYFISAFIGAALFVYFTFPRTKEDIPHSNNQRGFPTEPQRAPDAPPIPRADPQTSLAPIPKGPALLVLAWASGKDAKVLQARLDAFTASTGRAVQLTMEGDPATYAQELQQALASATPPDVCLIDARDFSGLDPAHDLAPAIAPIETVPRCVEAFTVSGFLKAVPTEFSVDVLFYNPALFDRVGLAYPGKHWNWDILEADSRAISSLHLTDASGQPIYALEMAPDFDLWNVLCAQAGHPALDLDLWHIADPKAYNAQERGLNLIHQFYQDLAITAPLPKSGETFGRYFASQQATMLVASSEMAATLSGFPFVLTYLPNDLTRASLARVNGWAIPAKSTRQEAARSLATYLARQPVHAGWCGVVKPTAEDTPEAICFDSLSQALLPRIGPTSAPMAQFLDKQMNLLAQPASREKPEAMLALIQKTFRDGISTAPVQADQPAAAAISPALPAPSGRAR